MSRLSTGSQVMSLAAFQARVSLDRALVCAIPLRIPRVHERSSDDTSSYFLCIREGSTMFRVFFTRFRNILREPLARKVRVKCSSCVPSDRRKTSLKTDVRLIAPPPPGNYRRSFPTISECTFR